MIRKATRQELYTARQAAIKAKDRAKAAMRSEAREILIAAVALLRNGVCRGAFARDSSGKRASYLSKSRDELLCYRRMQAGVV